MKCDFHIHSTFSDGKLTIPEIVDVYGTRGFGAIAITDHLCEEKTMMGCMARWLGRTLTEGSFPLYREILRSEAARAWDMYRMLLIPGYEITKNAVRSADSAHILAVGVSELVSPEGSVTEIARKIREMGGLAIAAHPHDSHQVDIQTTLLWEKRDELAAEFDAWEISGWNCLFEEVIASGLPKVANSDFHKRAHLSSWKTVVHCEKHPEAVLEAIRKRRVDFEYFQDGAVHGDPLLALSPALGWDLVPGLS